MKIVLFTLGSRGDVQPYAALGEALADRGHDVTLSTSKNFAPLVKSYHIKFHPIDIDYEGLLNSDEGRKILQVNVFAIQRNLDKHIYPIIKKSLNEFYKLAQASDLVIYRPKTMADVFTYQLNVKAIRAAVIPAMEETAAFLNPMFSAFNLPAVFNKLSYKFNRLRYRLLSTPINEFRTQNGLSNIETNDAGQPCIYGISPSFLERPKDWPENHHLTGFWFPKTRQVDQPEIDQFLKKGEAPLVVTFGSVPFQADLPLLINQAAEQLNQRFIVVKGRGTWDDSELFSENILVTGTADFESLLPQAKAVIHHGGIGTTAECMRAGKPMLVCPVLYPVGDQYFWADLAYKHGIASKPVPLKKMTPELFVENVRILLDNQDLYRRAAELGKKINAENGLEKAVSLIENICFKPQVPMRQVS